MADVDEVRDRLQAVADDLAELALDRLRRAVDSGGDAGALAAEERTLTRARRAVDKAIALLGDAGGDDGD